MKKQAILIIYILIALQGYSQNDSAFHKAVIIKINPGLMLEHGLNTAIQTGSFGELGGIVQVAITNDLSVFVGGGLNTSYSVNYQELDPSPYSLAGSHYGYTIRAGCYRFFNENGYLSFQFFYRRWASTTAFNFNTNDEDWAKGYNSDVNTNFTSAVGLGNLPTGATYDYYINNCSISVYSFDVVFGKQLMFGYNQHFLFEWFLGVGARLKNIQVEELGSVTQNQTVYNPIIQPNHFTTNIWTPDMQLGVMIGYKF